MDKGRGWNHPPQPKQLMPILVQYVGHIYLFIRHIPYPTTAGPGRNNAKKRDKKERTKKNRIEAEGETISPPNPGNWCVYGGRKKEHKTEGRLKDRR